LVAAEIQPAPIFFHLLADLNSLSLTIIKK